MSVEQAFEKLVKVMAGQKVTNVVVVSEPDESAVVQRLTLSDDLAQDFFRIARNATMDLGDEVQFVPYDAGYKPESHQRFYLELASYPEVDQIVNFVVQLQQAELFSEEEDVIDGLRYYAILISEGASKEAVFLREYSRKKELSRKVGIAAVLGKGTYTRLKEKVFLFDSKVDCVAWEGYLLLNNVQAFERMFKFFDQVMKKADETLDAILERVPVANEDEFRGACKGQPQMVSKLQRVATKPYFEKIGIEQILQTISDFGLDVELKTVNGTSSLVFNPSLKTRWTILNLLDDNYLGSTMTNLKYEVNSKSSLG